MCGGGRGGADIQYAVRVDGDERWASIEVWPPDQIPLSVRANPEPLQAQNPRAYADSVRSTAPGISVVDYLHRLAKHATLSPPLLLSMVYYIDRLCALYPDFTINTLTVHRFLITAATVAAKGLSDSFWNNSTYARVGGVRLAELKLLELEFLYRVDWRIVPNPEVLVAYYRGLVERSSGYVLQGEEGAPQEGQHEGVDGDDDEVDEDDPDEADDETCAEGGASGPSTASARAPGDGQAGNG